MIPTVTRTTQSRLKSRSNCSCDKAHDSGYERKSPTIPYEDNGSCLNTASLSMACGSDHDSHRPVQTQVQVQPPRPIHYVIQYAPTPEPEPEPPSHSTGAHSEYSTWSSPDIMSKMRKRGSSWVMLHHHSMSQAHVVLLWLILLYLDSLGSNPRQISRKEVRLNKFSWAWRVWNQTGRRKGSDDQARSCFITAHVVVVAWNSISHINKTNL